MFDFLGSMRRGLGMVRLVIAVVIGVPVLICVGIGAFYTWLFGAGSVHVMAPTFAAATVLVDGNVAAALDAGEHMELSVAQGAHKVTVKTDAGSADVDIDVASGFTELFVGGPNDRCFADLDVTDFYYEGTPRPPTIEQRWHGDRPYSPHSSTVYAEAALPKEISEHSHEYMVMEIPCDAMDAPEAQLVADLGFIP
jgi:hypothetical protein